MMRISNDKVVICPICGQETDISDMTFNTEERDMICLWCNEKLMEVVEYNEPDSWASLGYSMRDFL